MLIHRLYATTGICLLCATIVLQLYLTAHRYYTEKVNSAIASTILLFLPMIVVNAVSAILILREKSPDFGAYRKIVILALHTCQVGIVWRCIRIYKECNKTDIIQFCMLHIGYVTVSILPLAIMEAYFMKSLESVKVSAVMFVILSVIVVSFAIVHAQMATLDEIPLNVSCNRECVLVTTNTIGVTMLVLSRSLSFVLFFEIYNYWLFLIVVIHFVVILIILFYKSLTRDSSLKDILINLGRSVFVSYVNVVDSFDLVVKRSRCIIVLYYTTVLIENVVMSAVWMMRIVDSSSTKLAMVMIVLASYILGLVMKYCHHCLENEDSGDLIKALEITKEYYTAEKASDYTFPITPKDAGALGIPNGIEVDGHKLNSNGAFTNLAFDSTDVYDAGCKSGRRKAGQRSKETKALKHKSSSRSNTGNRTPKLFSHDTTSNTSRNTNTLNTSDEPVRCENCSGFIPGDYPMCEVRTQNDTTDHALERVCHDGIHNVRHKQNVQLRSQLVSGADKLNRVSKPKRRARREYFSAESDTIEDSSLIRGDIHYRKPRSVELRSHADTFTECSLSNYSYSYDSSSSSDSANTWPPRSERKLSHLPTENVSAEERISAWFQLSKQYFKSEESLKPGRLPKNLTRLKRRERSSHELHVDYVEEKAIDTPPVPNAQISNADRTNFNHNVNVQYHNTQTTNSNIGDDAALNCNSNSYHHHNGTYFTYPHSVRNNQSSQRDNGRVSRCYSTSSHNSGNNSRRSHPERRKIPYRDALEEYYRRGNIGYSGKSYHMGSNGISTNYNTQLDSSQTVIPLPYAGRPVHRIVSSHEVESMV